MSLRSSPRSLLWTSTTNVDRLLSTGWPSGADVGLLDLQDADAGAAATARATVARVLTSADRSQARVAVRIHPITTADGLRDLLALSSWTYRPDLVVLPRVDSPRDVEIAGAILAAAPVTSGAGRWVAELYPTVESPRGLRCAADIAAIPGVGGLVFGAAAYAGHTGSTREWEPLLYARSTVIAAAAAAVLPAIDSPTFAPHDPDQLHHDIAAARALGFTGKVAIHPDQVEEINSGYTPTDDESAAAEELLTAARRAGLEVSICARRGISPEVYPIAHQLLAHALQLGVAKPAAPPADVEGED